MSEAPKQGALMENSDRTQIQELEKARYQAMLDGDAVALEKMLAAELRYTHSNAESDGKDEYLAKVKKGVFRYLEISCPEEDVQIYENTAIVLGRMVGRVEVAGQLRLLNNKFVAVWLRMNGTWKLAVYQPTPMPAASQ